MRKFFKSTTGLVLFIVFLVAVLIGMFLVFAGLWLHTYNVFTQEKTVAEITISERKEDDLGEYVEVKITPIETDLSAVTSLFLSDDNPNPESLNTQTFKLYGDTIYVGGPILKFEDELILINFDTAYKLNTIFAVYQSDIEAERNRTDEMFSFFEIGDGDENYRRIADDIRDNNLRGRFFKIFFDSEPQSKVTGIFVSDRAIRGELVIRNDGFHWKLEEVLDENQEEKEEEKL